MTNIDNHPEIWRDVKGFEGRYIVSSYGRIVSLFKNHCCQIRPNKTDSQGYYNVSLRFKSNGVKRYCIRVHQLVAEHFCEKPITNERIEIDHIDSNRLNNHFQNLRYLPASKHRRISIEKGEMNLKGSNHPNVKITKEQVLEIRSLYASGKYTYKQISVNYNVGKRHICDIVNKVCWSWL